VHEKYKISDFVPKIMHKHTKGVVGKLIWVWLEIQCSLQQ